MNTRRIVIIVLAVVLVLVARYRFPKERNNPSNVIQTPGPYPDRNLDPLDPFPAPESTEPQVNLTAVARELAPRLNSPDGDITEDLDIINSILTEYRRAHKTNPVGLNEDITPALVGGNDTKAAYIPPRHRAVDQETKQLVDRWGTPFYFHPLSGTEMEIRSAGPDKELFTEDDVQLE